MLIDAEKLLGKVLSGALQGNVKRGKRRHRSSDSLVGSLLGGLTSGKGLITAIGLGVGAYEILKQQSSPTATSAIPGGQRIPVPPPMTGSPGGSDSVMPPPLPGLQTGNAVPPATPAPAGKPAGQNLALSLIRTMVAAAHADGKLDAEEERRILEKLQEQGLSQDERVFLLQELHAPRSIDELTAGVGEPMVAQTMYSLAVATIVVDTEEERQWLDQLAAALSLSPAMQRFIEQDGS